MPYVLAWNRPALEEKMVRLAAFLGLRKQSFEGVLEWILELRRAINIPNTLAELGVKDSHAEQFAPQAFEDPSTGGNPVPMTTEHFAALYRQCIQGQLSGI
jgi:alcohol dehydrogenase class IV